MFKRLYLRFAMIFFVALLLIILIHREAFAGKTYDLGEIIITGSKIEEPLEQTSASATIIIEQEIENQKAITVGEVLRNVAGIDVIQSGGPGGLTDILTRGGNSRHTLVLIDGVRVNSPTTGNFDFADLSTANIERIEIVRGAYSTLYGSDAMCGVVNIITKKGRGKPEHVLSLVGGSFETYSVNYALSGGSDIINYSLSLSNQDSKGFSAAKDGDEDDGYKNKSVASRFGIDFPSSYTIDLSLRYNEADKDFDEIGQDNPSYIQETNSLISSLNLHHVILDQWDHNLIFSLVNNKYDNKDDINIWNNSEIEIQNRTIQWQHNLSLFNKINTLVLGAEYNEQMGEYEGFEYSMETSEYIDSGYDESVVNKALFLQNQLNLLDESLFISAGWRIDDYSTFGSESTYKASIAYLFKDMGTKVKVNWGTAFKAPTLNSLYWPDSGNPELKAEESESYDIGIQQKLNNERISLSLCYFHNQFEHLIEWAPDPRPENPFRWTPQNVSRALTQGWEIEAAFELFKDLILKANHTFTKTEDKEKEKELLRRPKNKTSLTIDYSAVQRLNLYCTLNYVGDRWDDVANEEKIDAYRRLDLAAMYDINTLFQIHGKINNLLNEDYEEIPGYSTAGRSFYGGIKLTF
ncbi:MAG: TonB-dependent receptor plug domain-containing protein [bacterium]